MGFWENLTFQNGFAASLDPLNLTGIAGDNTDSNISGFKLPDWFEDPVFKQQQDFLAKFGIDILGGNVPDYYKPIGETGGPDFEKMLGLQNRNISQSLLEGAALTGRRGGGVQQMIGQAIAENTAKNRWADYARSVVGKESLLKTGVAVADSTRTAALTNQSQRNQFDLNRATMDFNWRAAMDQQDLQAGAMQGQAMSDILGTLLKGGVGFALGGPMGAAAAVTGLGGLGDISQIFGAAKAKIVPQVTDLSSGAGMNFGRISGSIGNNSNLYSKLFG